MENRDPKKCKVRNKFCAYDCTECEVKPKYKLERGKFISYYPSIVFQLTTQSLIIEDLIKGGEFIITAEDVLANLTEVDGRLVGLEIGSVNPKDCELYYEQED